MHSSPPRATGSPAEEAVLKITPELVAFCAPPVSVALTMLSLIYQHRKVRWRARRRPLFTPRHARPAHTPASISHSQDDRESRLRCLGKLHGIIDAVELKPWQASCSRRERCTPRARTPPSASGCARLLAADSSQALAARCSLLAASAAAACSSASDSSSTSSTPRVSLQTSAMPKLWKFIAAAWLQLEREEADCGSGEAGEEEANSTDAAAEEVVDDLPPARGDEIEVSKSVTSAKQKVISREAAAD